MRVRIEGELCAGHARCQALAPAVFDVDDQGYGVVLAPEVPPAEEESVQRAERNCPERAVLVEGD
jgi:ferredoxin